MKNQYGISIVLRNNGTYMAAYTFGNKSFLGQVVFSIPKQKESIFRLLDLMCKALNEKLEIIAHSS